MPSINTRIVASASIVLAIFIAATGLALDRAFRDSARSARQERLLGQVYLLIAATEVDEEGRVTIPQTLSEARFSLPASGLYGEITNSTGGIVWRSESALDTSIPSANLTAGIQQFGQLVNNNGETFFVYGLGVNWAAGTHHFPLTFTVAEDLAPFNAQLNLYRQSLWGWLGGMALLLLLAQAAVLRWSLRPLRRVARDLSAIESGRQQQLEGVYPLEIKKLTDNLNALIKRERAQQTRYRDALADLAHSLKTPLAVIRATLTDQAKQHSLPDTVEEQVARMDHIVAYQLQRAATAGRATGLSARISIQPIVEKIVASLNKVYRDKQIRTHVVVNPGAHFRGDEGDLTEVLGNLADNAYKWCKGTVQVEVRTLDNQLTITVEDDGPGIAAAEAAHVLERGVRADEVVHGHGIGLAVVRDIVQSYDGRIIIARSPLGGAAISLHLPN